MTTKTEHATTPFIVLIDTMEQKPFTFQRMRTDSLDGGRPLVVRTEWRHLGRGRGDTYEPRGDYSIDGYEGRCHVERKSMNDAHGTILGWGDRRRRFIRELEVLSNMERSAVVVECGFADLIRNVPALGIKTREQNQKILFRQVLAWQQDYRVPWVFCDGRRLAEIATFRILERFWRKTRQEELKHERSARLQQY